jgi:hypothetical protein
MCIAHRHDRKSCTSLCLEWVLPRVGTHLTDREHMACRQEGEGSAVPWDRYADVEALQTHWDDVPAKGKAAFNELGTLTRHEMTLQLHFITLRDITS